MKISVEILKNLDACEEGVARFESLYQSQELSVVQVINDNELTWEDVEYLVWFASKQDLPKRNYVMISHHLSSLVLPVFESNYPDDTRVRDCLNVVQSWLDGEDVSSRELAAAWAASSASSAAWAAWDAAAEDAAAEDAAAEDAAWSAAWAAWSAARDARAAGSAAWSAAAWAARSSNLEINQTEMKQKLLELFKEN